MEKNFREVYIILSDVSKLNSDEYERLISIYGEELVNRAIELLVFENEDNLYKFDIYFSRILSSFDECEENIKDLSIYDIYISDVSKVPCLDSELNMKLMKQANEFISQMNEIFQVLGCDDMLLGKNIVPWIADKVDYCSLVCTDIQLLNKLKDLYQKYCYVRDIIVSGNLRLVVKIANEYRDEVISFEDIIQEGNIGLIRAVEKFDVNKGVSFNTYAVYWVRQRMNRSIRINKYPIRLPMNMIYDCSNIVNVINELSLQLGKSVTTEEVAKYMDIPSKKIANILYYFVEPMYLDEPIESKFDDVEITRGDLISDDMIDVFGDAVNSDYREQLKEFLSGCLTEKEYFVLNLYSGLDGKIYTIPEISEILGVSQQRISKIKNNATTKLRTRSNIRDIIIV